MDVSSLFFDELLGFVKGLRDILDVFSSELNQRGSSSSFSIYQRGHQRHEFSHVDVEFLRACQDKMSPLLSLQSEEHDEITFTDDA